MSNVVAAPMSNKRDWKYHAERITVAWNKQVLSIIETGQALIDAKEELEHGSFQAMVQSKLPFDKGTARLLRIIAAHPIVSNRCNYNALPISYRTLFELTKLPDEILLAKIKDGSIHPKLKCKDAKAMRPSTKPKSQTTKAKIANEEPTTIDGLRKQSVPLLMSLTKEERIREIDLWIKAAGLNIHDWMTIIPFGKIGKGR